MESRNKFSAFVFPLSACHAEVFSFRMLSPFQSQPANAALNVNGISVGLKYRPQTPSTKCAKMYVCDTTSTNAKYRSRKNRLQNLLLGVIVQLYNTIL